MSRLQNADAATHQKPSSKKSNEFPPLRRSQARGFIKRGGAGQGEEEEEEDEEWAAWSPIGLHAH